MGQRKNPCWIVLLVLVILVFALTIAVNYVLSSGMDILGLNFTSQGDISDKYYTDITPASWAFSIWGVIYVWQAVWMIYCVTLIFRKNSETRENLYYSPPFISSMLFLAYIFNLWCNICWNFVWSLEYVHYALIFIALIAFFLFISLACIFYTLQSRGQQLINSGQTKDVIMTIVFVQNGIGIYASWVAIATLINLAIVLITYANVSVVDAGSIALGIVLFELLLWFVLDNFVINKACRYLFTPYFVLIYALAGSIDKNYSSGARNSILSIVLIALGCALLVVKVVLVVIKDLGIRNGRFRCPVFNWKGGKNQDENLHSLGKKSNQYV